MASSSGATHEIGPVVVQTTPHCRQPDRALTQRRVEPGGANPHDVMAGPQWFGRIPYEVAERRGKLGQGDVVPAQCDPSVRREAVMGDASMARARVRLRDPQRSHRTTVEYPYGVHRLAAGNAGEAPPRAGT